MPETPPLTMRPATPADIPLLCRLNQQLKDDEQARSRLPWDKLVARLEGWLRDEGYEAALFESGGDTVGYVIYRREPDPCVPDAELIYLRQFFVVRDRRRRGIGRRAFGLWKQGIVPRGMAIELDVLESNPAGRAFWEAIGLSPRMTRLRQESS
ncbi:MAG: GNAT family N-acetyltransferase [Planctomycetota bacterium]